MINPAPAQFLNHDTAPERIKICFELKIPRIEKV
jgi:hypothetical protein